MIVIVGYTGAGNAEHLSEINKKKNCVYICYSIEIHYPGIKVGLTVKTSMDFYHQTANFRPILKCKVQHNPIVGRKFVWFCFKLESSTVLCMHKIVCNG